MSILKDFYEEKQDLKEFRVVRRYKDSKLIEISVQFQCVENLTRQQIEEEDYCDDWCTEVTYQVRDDNQDIILNELLNTIERLIDLGFNKARFFRRERVI